MAGARTHFLGHVRRRRSCARPYTARALSSSSSQGWRTRHRSRRGARLWARGEAWLVRRVERRILDVVDGRPAWRAIPRLGGPTPPGPWAEAIAQCIRRNKGFFKCVWDIAGIGRKRFSAGSFPRAPPVTVVSSLSAEGFSL